MNTLPSFPIDAFLPAQELPPPPPSPPAPRKIFYSPPELFPFALSYLLSLRSQRGCVPPLVFLSHAHGSPFEPWIVRDFTPFLRRLGFRVLLDKTDNGPGTSMTEFIDTIRTAGRVVVFGCDLYFQKSLPSSGRTVAREVERIEERMRQDPQTDAIVPVLLEGEPASSLPPILWERVYVDLRRRDQFHAQMFDLLIQLSGLYQDPTLQPWRWALLEGYSVPE